MKNGKRLRVGVASALLLVGSVLPAAAQRGTPSLEELPRRAIDTLDTADERVKVVLYTNNTWSYHYTDLEERLAQDAFQDHWTTTSIFAYMDVPLKSLPKTVELKLIDRYEDFHTPVMGRVGSRYGVRGRRRHQGVDISVAIGEPIYAAFGGRVRYAQYNTGGYGNLVILRHANGLETWYGHLSRCNVEPGDYVQAGTVIGFGGNTGRSSGPHLHFEVRYKDQAFDPEFLIDFAEGDLRYQTFVLNRSELSIYSRASEELEEKVDYDGMLLAADQDGELTSEDILNNIETAEKKAVAEEKKRTDPLYHTIRRGDYLGKIARQYGTTVRKLCQLNNISENTVIRAGNRLRVR